jgi:hypothetical protein
MKYTYRRLLLSSGKRRLFMARKMWIPTTVVTAFVLLAVLMTLTTGVSAQKDERKFVAVPGITPTAGTPEFSAVMSVANEGTAFTVGETMVVRMFIEVSAGCEYPIYEWRLQQESPDGATFSYISPTTDTVGPPSTNPFTYTLRAETPGSMVLHGRAYGERYCGDFWNWTYVEGVSDPITITARQQQIFMPLVERE